MLSERSSIRVCSSLLGVSEVYITSMAVGVDKSVS